MPLKRKVQNRVIQNKKKKRASRDGAHGSKVRRWRRLQNRMGDITKAPFTTFPPYMAIDSTGHMIKTVDTVSIVHEDGGGIHAATDKYLSADYMPLYFQYKSVFTANIPQVFRARYKFTLTAASGLPETTTSVIFDKIAPPIIFVRAYHKIDVVADTITFGVDSNGVNISEFYTIENFSAQLPVVRYVEFYLRKYAATVTVFRDLTYTLIDGWAEVEYDVGAPFDFRHFVVMHEGAAFADSDVLDVKHSEIALVRIWA